MSYRKQLQTATQTIAYYAAQQPGHTAIIDADEAVSYAELDTRSSRVANALAQLGVGSGVRVAYLGHEYASYWEVHYGAAKAGAVLVPINWRLTGPEVAHILEDSEARVLFIDADHPLVGTTTATEILVDRRGAAPEGATVYASWRDRSPATAPSDLATPQTPLAQLYTSGTTGLPKGVVLPHRSFFAIRDLLGEAGLDWIDWRDGDRALLGMPGFYIGGLWYGNQAFNAGATVVVVPEFQPGPIIELIRRLEVTTAILVPTMVQSILLQPGAAPAAFRTLRKVIYGGAPVAAKILTEAIDVFGSEFAQIYGLTETGNTAVCLPPAEHYPGSPRLSAAGRPYPGVELRLLDEEGSPVEQGEVGEVHLRTPAAMLEYWRRPEATAETLVDGWIRTGDAGYLDEDGFLFIQDRVKDLIVVSGEKAFPAEIEKAITQHPAVEDAAVIGIPDEASGEAVLAFIKPLAGQQLTTRELARFLASRLAGYKVPKRFEFVETIPRNPSGKVLRRQLRQDYWRNEDRQV